MVAQVDSNGTVSGICEGTGIQPTAADYEHRATDYLLSQPALGSILSAFAEMKLLREFVQQ